MKQSKTFLVLALVVAVLALGIAYAAITSVTLNVNGNVVATPDQANFKVAFTGEPTIDGPEGATLDVSITDDAAATLEVSGLTTVGQTVTATFNIANTSEDITATLTKTDSNNNETYFEVTSNLSTVTLAPKTGSATLTVTIKLIKTPVANDVTAKVGVAVVAAPSN